MTAPDGTDEDFMRRALALAARAEADGEVPVGALVVRDGVVIGEGWNRPIGSHDPSAHAEIVAIRAAAAQAENYRLGGATLYVTLEPCAMCLGAIVQARIDRVVFGAPDPRWGVLGGAVDLAGAAWFNHRPQVHGGVMAGECGDLLRRFFMSRRG